MFQIFGNLDLRNPLYIPFQSSCAESHHKFPNVRERCPTMPTRKILLLWTSSSETQQCLVSFIKASHILDATETLRFRIWAVPEDDLVRLRIWIWRLLWTLPWVQFCFLRRDSLLVLSKTLQKDIIVLASKTRKEPFTPFIYLWIIVFWRQKCLTLNVCQKFPNVWCV